MKFKDPATGEVFHTIRQAVQTHCSFRCNDRVCPYWESAGCVGMLKRYTVDNPHEAARLMGYEVVEDDAPTMEEAINKCLEIKQKEASIEKPFDPFPIRTKNGLKIGNIELTTNGIEIDGRKIGMDKPLKDWTLGEIKRCCVESKQNCEKCPVSGEYKTTSDCKLAIFPAHWDLDDKPHFTQQEVEDAKTIKRMFGADNFTHIRKDQFGLCEMMDGPGDDPNVGWCAIGMEEGMFPSLRPGETITIDEIIGGTE